MKPGTIPEKGWNMSWNVNPTPLYSGNGISALEIHSMSVKNHVYAVIGPYSHYKSYYSTSPNWVRII